MFWWLLVEIRGPKDYLYDSICFVFNVGYSLFETSNFLANLFFLIGGGYNPPVSWSLSNVSPFRCSFQADTKGVSVLKSEDFAAWYTQAPKKWPCAFLFFLGCFWNPVDGNGHLGVSQNDIDSISSFYYFYWVFFIFIGSFVDIPTSPWLQHGEGILECNMM